MGTLLFNRLRGKLLAEDQNHLANDAPCAAMKD